MKSTTKLTALMAVFIGFIVVYLVLDSNNNPSMSKWEVGNQAQSVSLPLFEGGKLNQNKVLSLEGLAGKVVYVDFWASWCKPCLESFPALEKLYQDYNEQGFEIVAINLDSDVSKAEQFLASHPVSYSVVYDNIGLNRQLGINAMPTAYYIDRKGVVRLIHSGFVDGDEQKIEQAINVLLKEAK